MNSNKTFLLMFIFVLIISLSIEKAESTNENEAKSKDYGRAIGSLRETIDARGKAGSKGTIRDRVSGWIQSGRKKISSAIDKSKKKGSEILETLNGYKNSMKDRIKDSSLLKKFNRGSNSQESRNAS